MIAILNHEWTRIDTNLKDKKAVLFCRIVLATYVMALLFLAVILPQRAMRIRELKGKS